MRFLLLSLLLGQLSLPVYAREVAGVTLDEEIILSDNSKLGINGAGIRSKFFFKIYVGALYVSQPVLNSTQQVLSDPKAKRMFMHFLYDEVSKEKLNSGWQDGFENNLDEKAYAKLEPRLETFKSYFQAVQKGDVIELDYLPGQGTKITLNTVEKGLIPGKDFHQALMKVWLGEEPADWSLKDALLGQ
jgi:hypothetical protein